jgi:hypothetical protein
MKNSIVRALTLAGTAALAAGCAVLPNPDPRDPAPVKDGPVVMRVCSVEGDGAHLAVGDQVELATNQLGRLRIRHIPGQQNRATLWNGGEAARVKDAVLVESVAARGQKATTRRFVPVGRFNVRLGDSGAHVPFDFLTSKVTARVAEHPYPECIAEDGDDEVIVRGVEDTDRHGGMAHLR